MSAVLPAALLGLAGPALAASPLSGDEGGIEAIDTAHLSTATPDPVGHEDRERRKPKRAAQTSRTTSGASRPGAAPPAHTSSARPTSAYPSARPSAARPATRPAPSTGRTVIHSTPARPGRTVVHTTPRQPGRTVVHTSPGYGPGPTHHAVVHTAPRPRTVTYTHVYPYHGVFVYGPRPVTHVMYVQESGPVEVQRSDLPRRAVNRNDSLAVGIKAGSLLSGTPSGNVYGDPGLGVVGRYRPDESVGLELALTHHGMTLDPYTSRSQTQLAGSVELFAYPWTRVSPYVLAGATWNGGQVSDQVWNGSTYTPMTDVSSQIGLHAGLGLELAMGKSVALDLEGRYIGYLTDSTPDSPSAPGALQATAGLMVHFK